HLALFRGQMMRLSGHACPSIGQAPMHTRLSLFYRARDLLGYGTTDLAKAFGVSSRTVSRWLAHGYPPDYAVRRLALLVHERDPQLAAALALEGRTTLAALGLASFAGAHVHVVICAAAEAGDISPRAARPVVLAAFKRAIAIGLDPAAVVKG